MHGACMHVEEKPAIHENKCSARARPHMCFPGHSHMQLAASTCQHCGVTRTLGILSSRQERVGAGPFGQISVTVFVGT